MEIDLERLKRSILSVGLKKGRGFVVQNDYAIPASSRPPTACRRCRIATAKRGNLRPIMATRERPMVAAQIQFVDPLADIAVLTDWDSRYLVGHPLSISLPPKEEGPAWVTSLTGERIELKVRLGFDDMLWVAKAGEKFAGGMSGSPIIGLDGAAIGVVSGHSTQLMSLGSDSSGEVWAPVDTPQPCIAYCLPPRLGISATRRLPVVLPDSPPRRLRWATINASQHSISGPVTPGHKATQRSKHALQSRAQSTMQ
jgi:hypothetical protein